MKKINQLVSTIENVNAKVDAISAKVDAISAKVEALSFTAAIAQQRLAQKSSADAILEITTTLIAARFREGVSIPKWSNFDMAIEIATYLYRNTRNK